MIEAKRLDEKALESLADDVRFGVMFTNEEARQLLSHIAALEKELKEARKGLAWARIGLFPGAFKVRRNHSPWLFPPASVAKFKKHQCREAGHA